MNTVEQPSLLNDLLSHKKIHQNLSVPRLVEKILSLDEGKLTSTGAVQATTGKYTGRSPKDRFIVRDKTSDKLIDWGAVNQEIDEASFEKLYTKVVNYLKDRNELFLFQGFAGADSDYRLPVQVI